MRIDVGPLAEAIDRYLAKADEDLEELLAEEGFTDAAGAVAAINRLEDAVVERTQGHIDDILEMIQTKEGLQELVDLSVPRYSGTQELEDELKRLFRMEFDRMVRQFSFSYLLAQDPGLDVTDHMIAEQTQDQITQWSRNLAASTTKWVEPRVLTMISDAVKAGETVDGVTKLLFDSGIRDTEWKARRLALTEVLRMESMGQQDSFIQNPSCYKKKWKYTWQAKDPRENHIAINGQEVFKRETFTLQGADGATYHPLYPRDTCLPAGESINCHCSMEEVVDPDILGMSEDERSELRRRALEEANAEWEKEHAHDNVDMFKSMTEEQQLRYFGGKAKGAPYKSLIDSGVITTDEQLAALYGHDSSGKRYLKGLMELNADGIFTIDDNALKHAVEGTRTKVSNTKLPPGILPNGKPNGGFIKTGAHSMESIEYLKKTGCKYAIEQVYPNGVSLGSYERAKLKDKRYEEGAHRTGQAWFPKDWDRKRIRDAGTFVLNRYSVSETLQGTTLETFFANYMGVTVGVLTENGRSTVRSVFPDDEQRLIGGKK